MTEQRKAFENTFQNKDVLKMEFDKYEHPEVQALYESFCEGMQASQARIMELLESEEMVEVVAKSIIIARDGKRDGERRYQDSTIKKAYQADAKSAIEAIKRKINQGE